MPPQPRFAVDEMLGSLARWLRIMGYDTTYKKDHGDNEILRSAKEEGRIVLTRDEELASRAAPSSLYIRSDDLDQQLVQVASVYGLVASEDMVRCTVCNGELETAPKEELTEIVPKGALDSHDRFYRCKSCGKIYWKGSHWSNIRKRMESLHLEGPQTR